MPGENESNLDFAAFFNILYDWVTIFYSLSHKTMFGVGGFTDLIDFEGYSKGDLLAPDLAMAHTKRLARQLDILFSVYKTE
jgi:hypothetical protein